MIYESGLYIANARFDIITHQWSLGLVNLTVPLRHTFATLALQKGISLAAVQKALGRQSIKSTEVYLNYTDEHTLSEFKNKW